MGYSQSYSRTDEIALLAKITGLCVMDYLKNELRKKGLSIVKRETLMLDDDPYNSFQGERITLSDGRIIEHKLERTMRSDDSGHDHYGWYFSDEKPEVISENKFFEEDNDA